MEFRQSTTSIPPQFWPPPPQSLSRYRHFTDQRQPSSQGRISPWFEIGCNVEWFEQGMGRANGNVDMSYNVNPDILRALEKEKIREEIIAADRRRELEAEVRQELRIEREMAFRMIGGNAFDRVCVPIESWGKCLMPAAVGKQAMSLEERLRIQGTTETGGMDMLPFQRQKEKIIFVDKRNENKHRSRRADGFIGLGVHLELKAKPTNNLSGRKRKFESAGKEIIPELFGGGNKRGKKAWRCDLCQVFPPTEANLNDHLRGKKHQAREDAMSREKLEGENTGTGILPNITEVPNSEEVTPEGEKKGEKKAWRCDLCQVFLPGEAGLNDHLRGKKHKAMEEALSREKLKGENTGTGILPKTTEVPVSEEVTPKTETKAWICDLCQVFRTSKSSWNNHLKKKRHIDAMSRKQVEGENTGTGIVPKIAEEVTAKKLKANIERRVRKFEQAQKMYKDKSSFWCEMCLVGTNSETAMEAHRKGKKHSWMLNHEKGVKLGA